MEARLPQHGARVAPFGLGELARARVNTPTIQPFNELP